MKQRIRWTAAITVALVVTTPAVGQTTFAGRATNRGYPGSPTDGLSAAITLTIREADIKSGYLSIDPPLGGSGSATIHRWADSILVLTTSAIGDSIAWLGRVLDGHVAGVYRIIGGQSAGQWGEWSLDQTGGAPLQPVPLAARPFPDSVDVAAVLGLSAAAPSGMAPSEIEQEGSYLEFLGITLLVGFAFRLVTLVLLIPLGLLALLLSRASSGSADIQSAWLTQAALCAIYGTLIGLTTAAYVSTRGVSITWPYALTAFIWTYFALGANASEKAQSQNDLGWQTPEEAAVSQAAAIGLLVGLILVVTAYNWPGVVFVLPGARTSITWTLTVAEWLINLWLVRVILAVTVLGYVANVGMMVLVGGFMLLYSLWNGTRKLFGMRS